METSIQNIMGTNCIVISTEEGGEVIPVDAIASWGVLLGLTDTQDIIKAIREHEPQAADPGQPNEWTPLYEVLQDCLHEMAKAGVPAEFMVELLDPSLGAPVPGVEIMDRIAEAQLACPMTSVLEEPIATFSARMADPVEVEPAIVDLVSVIDSQWAEAISSSKVEFVDALVPQVLLPLPAEDPEPVSELI